MLHGIGIRLPGDVDEDQQGLPACRIADNGFCRQRADGLSEFVAPMRPADVVPRVLALAARDADGSAESAALVLVETACSAGAGDNGAVAVLAG